MSRQQKRANERKNNKTAFQKLCLAAGEGVGKAVAFSFALASHAGAAEPKKEEPITLPPVVVQDQDSPYIVPESSLSKFPSHSRTCRNRSRSIPQRLIARTGRHQLCAMRCAMCPVSLSTQAKAAATGRRI